MEHDRPNSQIHGEDEMEDGDGTKETAPLIRHSFSPKKPPPDSCHGVFFIFAFLGLASLLPWNFFITAKKYFDYKLRNTSLPANVSYDDDAHIITLQKEFESYLSIVSQGSNLFFMFLTVLLVRSIAVKVRVVISTLLVTLVFIVTTALVKIDTDSWQNIFFFLTLIMAAFMAGVQSVLTGSVLGLSAMFPPKYSQSTMMGQAVGGTFSAVASVLTLATAGDATTSALIFFLIATVVTILSLVSYICLHFLNFSKYFMALRESSSNINDDSLTKREGDTSKRNYYIHIFKKTWVYCLSVCLVFTVTLSVFPAVCSLIKSTETEPREWTKTYFTPVVCFFLFNMGDFLGRLLTFAVKWPSSHRPYAILVLTILRVAFIPLLMLCNVQPRSHLLVKLDNDAYPIVLILSLGLTNGYLGTLCMSFGPLRVKEDYLEGAGITLALAMTLGLALGSGFSYLFINLV